MDGSSAWERKNAENSPKPLVLTEKISGLRPLKGLDAVGLSRETDIGVGKFSTEELETQAVFTTPRNETSDISDRGAHRKDVLLEKELHDIYFQFDSWRLTGKSRRVLEANAEWLKAHPHERITIEGHCDARGTQAYNYVLGEKRATMVQQYLGFLGIPHQQLVVTSFGKDKPKCHIYSESCFQQNRRAHFDFDLNLALTQ